jgi:hypothetical protein
MTDHRRIQRALFRMQHDRGLAARVIARDPEAVRAVALSPADLDLLLGAAPAGIAADPEGKRRAQFLRNAASELALSAAWATAGGADPQLIDSFPSSAGFHGCIDRGERLPLAIGEHALARAERWGDRLLIALVRLELALTRARRGDVPRKRPAHGAIVLAPRADVLELPAGTMDAATLLRTALDEGRAPPDDVTLAGTGCEHVLVAALPATSPHRLREVSVELLGGLAGALLAAAREPMNRTQVDAFCAVHDVSREELDAFADSLEEEGLMDRGT